MNYNPKVVSFERSAAYVHHRAMKNRRDNNPLDALELLRQAVEQSPDNREYRLDLAEMYCEMGCHEQSNRILLDMLALEDAPSECYYGLALNQLGRNEPDAAKRALALYRSHAGEGGGYAQDADGLAEEMELYDALRRPGNRKHSRAAQIAGRACDALKAEDVEKALRLFERSLEMYPHQSEMRTLYAMALRMSGDDTRALSEAEISVSSPMPSVRTLCVAAQIFGMCGDPVRAHELAEQAIAQRPRGVELRLMIFTLSEMKMHSQAADALKQALWETPHDKALLHMRAIALHRAGVEDAKLASFWARILRIDPGDTVARYYHEAATQNRLGECEAEFIYEVPNAEFRRRLLWIAEKLSEGIESAVKLWQDDSDFRGILLWAVGTGDVSCGRAAMMVIASARDAESESILRELLYRGDIPTEVKLHGAFFLRLRGADMQRLLPPDADVRDGLLPEAELILQDMPVGERQLVRFADDVLSQDYGVQAKSALALMWQAYRREALKMRDPLVCTQEAAAALAWNYLLTHGVKASPRKLAKQFECRTRRMVYYAGRMAAALEKNGSLFVDEDH